MVRHGGIQVVGWSLYTGSDAAIDLVSAWLRQCTNSHEICRKSFSDHVPTRLLDLDGGLDAADIRLVLTSDIGTQRYVTLGYTWGTSTSVSLTEDSIESFQTGIPVATLPKTIRDAIRVCRMLQVRFLWVDALCIIQNNSQGFAQEVSQMGSIYANSLLTIAASDTADCNEGFLVARYPLQTEDCQILDDSENIVLFAGTVHDYLSHYHDERYLDTRAWVFQERAMSPRTVHSRGSEIEWECREWLTCQRCIVSPQSSEGLFRDEYRKGMFRRILEMTYVDTAQNEFEHVWSHVLWDYTRTHLSNEDDRLSALAGIAQLLNHHNEYKSSFGLWHPIFLNELLWFKWMDERNNWQSRKNIKAIPSWSWVNLHGAVNKFFHVSKATTDVYSAEVIRLPPATSFGQISTLCRQFSSHSSIKVRSWATGCQAVPTYTNRSTVISVSGSRHDEDLNEAPVFHRLSWDSYSNSIICTDEQERFLTRVNDTYTGRFYFPDQRPTQSESLVCLLMKRTWVKQGDPAAWPKMCEYGLVLKCVDADKNVYQRQGVYREEHFD
jgi:hypothetical protein